MVDGNLSKEELKRLARSKGLSPSGTKQELLLRLARKVDGVHLFPQGVPLTRAQKRLFGEYQRPLPEDAY